MYKSLFSYKILNAMREYGNTITEIRMRVDKPLELKSGRQYHTLPVCVTAEDIDEVMSVATHHSRYAFDTELRQGFVTYNGGIRIGVAGEVTVTEHVQSFSRITSLCISIPHQITGAERAVSAPLAPPYSCLVVGCAGSGKTTLLRELARSFSAHGCHVLVVDERRELAGAADGVYKLELGDRTDVLSGLPKKQAYESAVRAMRPDVIFTDEIYSETEVDTLITALRSGVKVCAAVHGSAFRDVRDSHITAKLFPLFDYYVLLERIPVGHISRQGTGNDIFSDM